ncbi:hypothetical protein [Maribacter sp. IgM3_T14_3]|uniref:hypothetical protein n=1 Tax=Maribacter sp. IgM3_T14_3 TaxID=3415140 RepID=UPI003C700955
MRLFLILPIFLLFVSNAIAQDLKNSKDLGFISYLTLIKVDSEHILIELDNNESKSIYANLKLQTDILINQLCTDMTNRGGLKLYRALDDEIDSNKFTNERLVKFEDLIGEIDSLYGRMYDMRKNLAIKQEPYTGIGDVLDIFGLKPYSVYNDIATARGEKTEKIVAQIKELKLQPLKKPEEKKKENLLNLTELQKIIDDLDTKIID